MKIIDIPRFEFKVAWTSVQPACGLRVWRMGRGGELTHVALYQELHDYEGKSVTNAAERIATEVMWLPQMTTVQPARVLWVEHYPSGIRWRGKDPESFDLVTFTWDTNRVASRPVWHRVSREWLEGLLRESV